MLVIGDKVEVIEHADNKYVGQSGEVTYVTPGVKRVTEPAGVAIPSQQTEPHYGVKLDNGKELHYLREQQLRKM
jgi:RNase P/RNase MRP subunit p29